MFENMPKRTKILAVIMVGAIIFGTISITGDIKKRKRKKASSAQPVAITQPVGQPTAVTLPPDVVPQPEKTTVPALTGPGPLLTRESAPRRGEKTQAGPDKWGRDPFLLPGEEGRDNGGHPPSSLKLEGIVWVEEQPEKSYCIINQEVYWPDGEVAGYHIDAIKKDEVLLSKGTRKYSLKIIYEE